jgi:hypothetical protein
MKSRPEDSQQTHSVSLVFPLSVAEDTLEQTVRLREHRHNPKDDFSEKFKLAQHAYEEGRELNCDFAVANSK